MTTLDTVKIGRRALLAAVPAAGVFALRREVRASAPVRVRFAFFGDPVEQLAYDYVVDAFEAANPGVGVERIAIASTNVPPLRGTAPAGGYPEWLDTTAFASDNPPDVFLLGYRDIGRYARRGIAQSLDAYLAGSNVFALEDFYPQAIEAFRTDDLADGTLGAIPQNVSSLAVFYNTELFDRYGVPRPTNDWSWETFGAAAKALTLDRNGNGKIDLFGLAFEPTLNRYAAFIWGAGGAIFDDVKRPTRLLIDSPESRDGIRWLTSLGVTGARVMPSEVSSRNLDDTRRFQAGGAAMLIQSRRVVAFLRESGDLQWDVAPLPVGRVPANVLHSDGLAMWTGAKDKAAAWAFIEFAMGPRGQEILAASGRTVPSLTAVAESDAFLKGSTMAAQIGVGLPPQNARVFLDNIPISRPLPSSATWGMAVRQIDSAVRRAIYVDGDVDAAVTRAIAGSSVALETATDFRQLAGRLLLPESED